MVQAQGGGLSSGISEPLLEWSRVRGEGVQGDRSLPHFLASFNFMRMKWLSSCTQVVTKRADQASCLSVLPLGDRAGPGPQALLWGHPEAHGCLRRCLAQKQVATRKLCALGGFLGNSSNAWHRHFPPLVTGAHTSGSIELL